MILQLFLCSCSHPCIYIFIYIYLFIYIGLFNLFPHYLSSYMKFIAYEARISWEIAPASSCSSLYLTT